MKDGISTPMREDNPSSPNDFEKGKPGSQARDRAEAQVETLREQGGIFVEAVKATRMPMVVTDVRLPGNPIIFANEAFLDVSGYAMDEVLGQQPHFMTGSDTDSEDARRFRDALDRKEDVVVESWQYRKDGSRFCAAVFCRPLVDEQGRAANHFLSYLDITGGLEAEAYRHSEILESISDAFYAVDRDWRFTYVNRKAEEWWGRRRQDLIGKHYWEEFAQAVGSDPYEAHLTAAKTREVVRLEARSAVLDKWVDITIYPTADGGLSVYFRDISERAEAEAALRESERNAQSLLAELQHRVRNTLAVVRSIARRTAESSDSTDDMISHFEGRLNAFSRVQSAVTRSSGGAVDVKSLIEDELLAVAVREGKQLKVDGPELCLKSKAAESLSLAIHELATNAVKYGALSALNGSLSVHWKRIDEPKSARLHLEWLERGLDTEPRREREGFGHEMLLRTLPFDLAAETSIEFTSDGMRFTMDLPLGPEILAETAQ